MANENFVVRHGLTVCGNARIDSNLGVSGTLCVKGVATLCSDLNIGNGRITVSTNNEPNIQIKGAGPNIIRFYDDGSTSATNALDLVYRTSPNTLGFEKSSDGTKIWESDYDTLCTTFHENVTISKNLGVQGNASVSGNLRVVGNTSVDGRLDVSGHVSAASGTFTGMVSCEDIDVSGNVTTSTLTVNNAATISTLTVSGNVTTSTLTVTKSATISTLTVNGNVTTSTLTVNAAIVNGILRVVGNTSLDGRLDVSGHVSAASGTFTGTLSCEDVDVSGNVTTSTLTVNNAATISALTVSGAATISTLRVVGNTSVDGRLDVSGHVSAASGTFTGTLSCEDVDVSGNVTTSTLTVTKSATISTLTVSGSATVKDKLTIEGTTSTIGGTTFDNGWFKIGNSTAGIAMDNNEIYFAGAGNIGALSGNLNLKNNVSVSGGLTVAGSTSIDGRLDVSGHVSAKSATLTGTLSCEDVDVSGNVTTSTLTVTKSATISTLTVSGRVTTSTLTVNKSATISTLTVSGNVTTSTLTVNNTATISADTQVKTRLTVGSGHIGSRNPGFSVISDNDSSPIVAKVGDKNTTFSILPWTGGVTYIASGIYYDDGSWVHSSDNAYNCLFLISGTNGAKWYASSNSSGSWNVASNKSLWTNSGQWDSQLSTNVTYNGNTIYHSGLSLGSGSGLDADRVDGYEASALINNTHTSYSASNKAVGWYTIATNSGNRAIARFGLRDVASGDHQSCVFYASHHYGNKSEITILHSGRYSGNPFRYIRIKEGGTYDGALLQIYIDDASNNVTAYLLGDNFQSSGWVLRNWVSDGTDPGGVSNFGALTNTAAQVDINQVLDGGMVTTGNIYAGGDTTQYRVLTTADEGAGNGIDADNLDGYTWASSGKNIRGTEIYADNWFRNYNSGEGLYNEANGMHWYSQANNSFSIYSGQTSVNIKFMTSGGNTRGYVYADTGSSIGFLNTGGQWGLRYLSNDGNSPNLYFREEGNETWTGNPGNDMGKIEYHSNRFYIASGANSTEVVRFRRSGTNVAYIDNSGNIYSTSSNYRCLTTADEGSGNGIDADLLDGYHASSFHINGSGNDMTASAVYAHNWLRTYGEEGLYSQSYAQHFYPDSGGFYWECDGPIRHRDGYEGTIIGYSFYHDGNGKGLLDSTGSWWLHQGGESSGAHLTIGGHNGANAYNSYTGRRLMFGGSDTDARDNYYIGTNLENYGGNYNKLDLRWHTGIRMGAQPGYGGIRFYDTEDLGTQVFAIGKDGSYAQANQSMRAPIFYDLNNTGYYTDPASTSRMNQIQANTYYSPYSGADSNLARSSYPYGWGFQEDGAWSNPYPDLVLQYHTGVTLAAYHGYDGISFKQDYNDSTVRFRINGSSHYTYKYTWMYTNSTGYYSGDYSWHISPNDRSSYGSMRLRGSKNGWYGHCIDTGKRPHVMFDGSGNGGFYNQDDGRWHHYYNHSNNCIGFLTSTTSSSYGLYVAKGVYALGTIFAASDIRVKKDIKTITNALEKVLKLRGVTFIKTNYAEDDPQNGKTEMGVIAQEITEVVPEVVNYAEDVDEYAVSYGNLAGLFIEAMKEQNEIINNLREEVSELKKKLGK